MLLPFLLLSASAIAGAVRTNVEPAPTGTIAWYGTLAQGLAEAERSGRAILLQSAAPQCRGVPGMW